jgi:hypothetical protein
MVKNGPAKCFLLLLLTVAVPLFAEDSVKTADFLKDSFPQSTVKEKPNPYADADISVKIMPSANRTYGYGILIIRATLSASAEHAGTTLKYRVYHQRKSAERG